MASSSGQEIHATVAVAEVHDISSPLPPLRKPISTTAIDTPPDTPTAEPSSPTSTCAEETADNKLKALITQHLPSRLDTEAGDYVGVGQKPEQDPSAASQTDVETLEVEATEIKRTKTAALNEADIPAQQDESCKLQPKQRDAENSLSDAETEVSAQPKLENHDDTDNHLSTKDDEQIQGCSDQDEVLQGSDDELCGDDEDTAVDMPQQISIAPEQPRSIPPHMRPNSRPSSAPGDPFEAKRDWPAQMPRNPRVHLPVNAHLPSRLPLDYDELQRTRAQLMKARSDLEVEKKANAEMRKTIGAEKQASIAAAMSNMLADLLLKQADVLTAKAKNQEKERELQHREETISQLEVYLSDGQKQLRHQLDQNGIRSMSEVDAARLRREVELQVKHQLSAIEGKICIQVERLQHQEAAQKIREQQYKVLVRDDLENEVREQLVREMRNKVSDSKATEAAYERGLTAGKKTGGNPLPETALKNEFLKGYATCYQSQTALHNLRNDRLAADSPELAFLFDPTHAENPHNIGLSIGSMTAETLASSTVNMVMGHTLMGEDSARAATSVKDLQQAASPSVIVHGRGQGQINDTDTSRSSRAVACQKPVRPVQQACPQPVQQEQVQRTAPPRPTFAGELRGASAATSNGVFASRTTTTAAPTPPRTHGIATHGATGAGPAGRVDQGVYAGRRIIRYEEDSEDEPASPNLIDLY